MSGEREEWRPVVGYEGFYEVSSLGRVRSVDRIVTRRSRNGLEYPARLRGQLIRGILNKGYLRVALSRGCRPQRLVLIHVAVLRAFVGDAPPMTEAGHRDGKRLNNVLSNLYWISRLQNAADRDKHGTTVKGTSIAQHKLTDESVRAIRRDSRAGWRVGADYGVSKTVIQNIRNGKSWKHI